MLSLALLSPVASDGFVGQIVLVLAASAVLAYACHRLRLVPIVGFLAAGVCIGPNALGWVRSAEVIDGMAEVGVILLLFTIGVEFSLGKLALIRRPILVGGGLQVSLTIAATALALAALGVDAREGVYTGCLVALSSTAIVLKLLADEGSADTPAGRIALGILIFQDLAVVAMVLLLPMLAGGGAGSAGLVGALGRAVGIIALVLFLASRAAPPLLDRVARLRSAELFLLTVMTLCFGIAWLTSLGGVSLSLGAFLAGLVVSGSRFREHAVGEILPLRTLFNAVFFVSVGMLLDPNFILERPVLVVIAAVAVLGGKVLITGLAVIALRYPRRVAMTVGLALAQIGEFSFVLEGAGGAVGLSPAGLGPVGRQAFLAVTVLLMAATPFTRRLELRPRGRGGRDAAPAISGGEASTEGLRDHVIIGGYGLAGRALEASLASLRIPHIVVDLNPVSVLDAEAAGVSIVYGDLTHPSVLQEVRADRARLAVIAINDPEAAARTVQRLSLAHPALEVIVRVPYAVDADAVARAGAAVVVMEEVESAVRVLEEALHGCGVSPDETLRQVARLRARIETA